jgi:hypothetical protein
MKFTRFKSYKYSFFLGAYVAILMYAVTIACAIVFKNSMAFYAFMAIDVLITLSGFAKYINWNVKNNPMLRDEDESSGGIDLSEYVEEDIQIRPRWLADYVTLAKMICVYRHVKKNKLPESVEQSFSLIAGNYYDELDQDERNIVDRELNKLSEFFNSYKEEKDGK